MESIKIENIHTSLKLRIPTNREIDELSKSMIRYDLLSPILVRPHASIPSHYELVFGYRRLLAAKQLNWQEIPARIINVNDEEALILSLVENIERSDFTDYEKAKIFKKLHDEFGKTYEQIATCIDKSPQYVQQHIAMLNLFDKEKIVQDEQAYYIMQNLKEHNARILLRLRDPEERFKLAKIVVAEGLSVSQTDKLVGRPRYNIDYSKRDLEQKRIIDLTLALSESTPIPSVARFEGFSKKVIANMPKDSYKEYEIVIFSNIGTHLEIPYYMADRKETIDMVPLDKLVGRGAAISVKRGGGEEIESSDLRTARHFRDTKIVLIDTGWDSKYGTEQYKYHPYLSEATADFIISQNIELLGIDTLSVELPAALRPQSYSYPALNKLLKNNVMIVESLTNVRLLVGRKFRIFVMPLKIFGVGSSPARVVAELL